MREELIRIENGIKTIDGYDFLAGIHLQIYRNEICGIISAEQKEMEQLWSVLQGNQSLDHGTVFINEKKTQPDEYRDILKSNVRLIDGYSNLIKGLNLAENMFIVSGKKMTSMFVNKTEDEHKLKILFEQFNININIHTPVENLSRLQQLKFELLKAYMHGIRLVLVDLRINDFTSSEIEELFSLIIKIKKRNMTFMIWNPVLTQLVRYSDYMIIIKNGKTSRVYEQNDFSIDKITHILLGDVQQRSSINFPKMKDIVFQMEGISDSYLYNINLSIKAGELLFIQCEKIEGLIHLSNILSGRQYPESGYMMIGGKLYNPDCFEDAIEYGIGFIEESTFSNTLFYNLSVFDNVCMIKGNSLKSIWWKSKYRQSLKKKINQWFDRDVCDLKLSNLSENELQKVLFCRWMLYRPKILVLVNPFIGGSINMNENSMINIHKIADQGTGIIILSTNEIPFPALCKNGKILTGYGELKERLHYYV